MDDERRHPRSEPGRPEYLYDKALSWMAIGLMTYLLHIADEQGQVNIGDLLTAERGVGSFHPSQKDTSEEAFDELLAIGYVEEIGDGLYQVYEEVDD